MLATQYHAFFRGSRGHLAFFEMIHGLQNKGSLRSVFCYGVYSVFFLHALSSSYHSPIKSTGKMLLCNLIICFCGYLPFSAILFNPPPPLLKLPVFAGLLFVGLVLRQCCLLVFLTPCAPFSPSLGFFFPRLDPPNPDLFQCLLN